MSAPVRTGSWGVSSPHPAATEAAAGVLAGGGTAVDAAICAAGVLTVVYPHNCSIGGDLVGLVRKGDQVPTVVYGVGRAGRRADPDALRTAHGHRMPVVGPHSITVPGVVSGWVAMHEAGGSLPFASLLEPAMELAANGVAVSPSVGRALAGLETDDPGMREVFGTPGGWLGEGDRLVQPRLAETIARVAKDPGGYYRGELAARLAGFLASVGSPLDAEDFDAHQAVVSPALQWDGGRLAPRLFTADRPSQGAFLGDLVAALSALLDEGRELTGRDAGSLAVTCSEFSQLRDELLCDSTVAMDPGALAARRHRLHLAAGGDAAHGDLAGAPHAGRVETANGTAAPSGDTVAVVVRDGKGDAVSMLQSVFHSFGSKVLDPETGVLFHNRGAMFTLQSGALAELVPGRRPPHTLCPVMVDGASGAPRLVLATMGGRAQPQVLARVLLALEAGAALTDALRAPRFVVGDADTRGSYRAASAEQDVPNAAVGSLAASGFDVRMIGALDESTGHAQALRAGSGLSVEGASDPRADGTAICGP